MTLNMTGVGTTSRLIVQAAPAPSYHKLRTFSGKEPLPPGQVDYDTWRMSAAKLVNDMEVTSKQKFQKLQESLAKPALNQAEGALDGSNPKAVLTLLDQVYGCITDGRTLLKQFYSDEQGDEKASDYLSRLYLQLQKLMKKGVVAAEDSTSELCQQFIAGCQDDTLLLRLHLDSSSPPQEYGTLLSSIRKEEARRTRKSLTKRLARSNQVEAEEVRQLRKEVDELRTKNDPPRRNLEQEVEDLRQEIALLKQQRYSATATSTSDAASTRPSVPSASASRSTQPQPQQHEPPQRKKKRRFCFKCGIFDHVAGRCENAANPTLVMQRWAEREKEN